MSVTGDGHVPDVDASRGGAAGVKAGTAGVGHPVTVTVRDEYPSAAQASHRFTVGKPWRQGADGRHLRHTGGAECRTGAHGVSDQHDRRTGMAAGGLPDRPVGVTDRRQRGWIPAPVAVPEPPQGDVTGGDEPPECAAEPTDAQIGQPPPGGGGVAPRGATVQKDRHQCRWRVGRW
ncbi:hypothetical protein GCM10023223_14310 [Stackebrandtia albiflava]